MGLEALKFLIRREVGVFVVEMQHEADRNEPVVEMIEERAAAGAVVERPAERVLRQAGMMFFRRDLPQLFQAEAEFLRLAAFGQAEALHERFCETAARALGEQRVFRAQLHAAGEAILLVTIPLWWPPWRRPVSRGPPPPPAPPPSNSPGAAAKPG